MSYGSNPEALPQAYSKSINEVRQLNANASVKLLDANPKRIHVLIVSKSEANITLKLANGTAAHGQGVPLLAKGSYYEINILNLYRGEINVIADAVADLSVVEGSL